MGGLAAGPWHAGSATPSGDASEATGPPKPCGGATRLG